MAIAESRVLDPAAGVYDRHRALHAQAGEIAVDLGQSCRWVPAAELASLRHQEDRQLDPLPPAQGQQLAESPVRRGGDVSRLQVTGPDLVRRLQGAFALPDRIRRFGGHLPAKPIEAVPEEV